MAWRKTVIDPSVDKAAAAVRAAFDAARNDGRSSAECYQEAVAVWHRAHPDQTASYAAKQAVAVVLAAEAKRHFEIIDMDTAGSSARSMSDGPGRTAAKQAEHATRDQRLAQALRDNLRRRKEQARAQSAGESQSPAGEAVPAAPLEKPPA